VVLSLPLQQAEIGLHSGLSDSSARGGHNLVEPGGHGEC